MSSQLPMFSALRCAKHQRWLLRSFLSGVGHPCAASPFVQQRNHLGTIRQLREPANHAIIEESLPLNDINEAAGAGLGRAQDRPRLREQEVEASASSTDGESLANPAPQQASHSYVPWYLQQKTEKQLLSQPVAAGQDAPEIPPHPPFILEPLADHVLSTLGLSHIKVLDLRTLTDPPPALGANLFMLLATARSERHLHASADKLCRWLRTEYKLTPFADGLLGRNEMKIAIRRRTRRAKMMSAVGVKSGDGGGDVGDGLRSGWICVNVGRVDGGILPEAAEERDAREFVGFGTRSEQSTLVVQMLTEEKREEMGLERLWEGAVKRQAKQREKLTMDVEEQAGNTKQSQESSIGKVAELHSGEGSESSRTLVQESTQ